MSEARRCTATEVKIRWAIGSRISYDDMIKVSDILNERQAEVNKMLKAREDAIASLVRKLNYKELG